MRRVLSAAIAGSSSFHLNTLSGTGAEAQDYFDPFVAPLATAETMGTREVPAGTKLAAKVGCGCQCARCLRATSASTLVKAEPGIVFPITDGTVLTQRPDSAFARGEFNRVPIINGTNPDEWRFVVASQYDLPGHPLTNAKYPAAVAVLISSGNRVIRGMAGLSVR